MGWCFGPRTSVSLHKCLQVRKDQLKALMTITFQTNMKKNMTPIKKKIPNHKKINWIMLQDLLLILQIKIKTSSRILRSLQRRSYSKSYKKTRAISQTAHSQILISISTLIKKCLTVYSKQNLKMKIEKCHHLKEIYRAWSRQSKVLQMTGARLQRERRTSLWLAKEVQSIIIQRLQNFLKSFLMMINQVRA